MIQDELLELDESLDIIKENDPDIYKIEEIMRLMNDLNEKDS